MADEQKRKHPYLDEIAGAVKARAKGMAKRKMYFKTLKVELRVVLRSRGKKQS